MRLVPVEKDLRIPEFKKRGEITLLNYDGKELFIIAMFGTPFDSSKPSPYEVPLQDIKDAGFNLIIKTSGNLSA